MKRKIFVITISLIAICATNAVAQKETKQDISIFELAKQKKPTNGIVDISKKIKWNTVVGAYLTGYLSNSAKYTEFEFIIYFA